MLTRLHFKNWRSLHDVEIKNLTPITVLVGANSSGKTNILDALHFIQHSVRKGVVSAVQNWGGRNKLRTLGTSDNDIVELEYALQIPQDNFDLMTEWLALKFQGRDIPFQFGHKLTYGQKVMIDGEFVPAPFQPSTPEVFWASDEWQENFNNRQYFSNLIGRYEEKRWQLLKENFLPSLVWRSEEQSDPFLIDPEARNVPFMLDFMKQVKPDVYAQLQDDLSWLLGHVKEVHVETSERGTRLFLEEMIHQSQEAPTISDGTKRIVAILTAFYALDLPSDEKSTIFVPAETVREPYILTSDLPGLVVIEEPDVAIHPLLLGNLIDLLRQYTEDKPRQFILTTHNPMLLNLFSPEEVRIVERDDQGYTTVREVNKDVANVWHEKYGDYSLGEIWTTRLLGGVPE